jgi:hypothetical protein
VIHVDAGRGMAWAVALILLAGNTTPQRMVENEDLVGAGDVLQKTFGFRLVRVANLLFILKIGDRGSMFDHREPLTVQRECVIFLTQVVNRQGVGAVLTVVRGEPSVGS